MEKKMETAAMLGFKELKLSYHDGYTRQSIWVPEFSNLD